MRFILTLLFCVCLSANAAQKDYAQKEAYEGCNGIKDNDKKAYCIALDGNKADLCNKIGNNDLQNKCLAKINNDAKFCKRINDEKKRKSCEQYIR